MRNKNREPGTSILQSSVVEPTTEKQLALPGVQGLQKFRDAVLPKKLLPRHWSYLAITLLALYAVQEAVHLHWHWLAELQKVGWYRWCSGAVLAFFVGYQWYLFAGRLMKKKLGSALIRHQQVGVLAPVVFYAHSIHLGFGMILALSLVYLVNILIGALNPAATGIKARSYRPIWFVTHIALSFLLVVMMVWHVWIGVYFH